MAVVMSRVKSRMVVRTSKGREITPIADVRVGREANLGELGFVGLKPIDRVI